mmetsp:Transcript_561/g.917  ORF Transcript_561/g.917 Transcript_561/m.917 type:complete len:133 (+) Transcript_561:358-756(+)|eukprot:scaffold253315_cov35-Tisochrysis_lutea.AAC.7
MQVPRPSKAREEALPGRRPLTGLFVRHTTRGPPESLPPQSHTRSATGTGRSTGRSTKACIADFLHLGMPQSKETGSCVSARARGMSTVGPWRCLSAKQSHAASCIRFIPRARASSLTLWLEPVHMMEPISVV